MARTEAKANAKAARAAKKAQAGDTAAAAAGTPARVAEAVVGRTGVLSDLLDGLGTVMAKAIMAGEVVGAVVGAAVAVGFPLMAVDDGQ
jgi:hypothetical protein